MPRSGNAARKPASPMSSSTSTPTPIPRFVGERASRIHSSVRRTANRIGGTFGLRQKVCAMFERHYDNDVVYYEFENGRWKEGEERSYMRGEINKIEFKDVYKFTF